jgi:hypothetical protein
MAIGTDYSAPVMVNGFSCKNCTDVDYAKKHIDPAHPRSGPYGIDAKVDPSVKQDQAVKFDGALAGLNGTAQGAAASSGAASQSGAQLDISV